ncbi:MAG TPA: tail fiber domain-containing protein, partial [Myxococcota bacterium]|nr:tail fiber domain-containing protein [Myxococcota bacterium]
SAGGIGVLVNASGVLGTTTSSARFKQDVRDMGDASDLLMRLRPVTFRYTEDAVGADEARTPQYGLIAEEVAAVAPELVAPDLDGKPYSVKYHELPALLLNEVQEQEREIAELKAQMAQLQLQLADSAANR